MGLIDYYNIDIGSNIASYLREKGDRKDPEQIDRMERFLVLFNACQYHGNANTKIMHVNLYNAAYYQVEQVKKILQQEEKFTTGIEALDKRVKKWDNIYDLNRTVMYPI